MTSQIRCDWTLSVQLTGYGRQVNATTFDAAQLFDGQAGGSGFGCSNKGHPGRLTFKFGVSFGNSPAYIFLKDLSLQPRNLVGFRAGVGPSAGIIFSACTGGTDDDPSLTDADKAGKVHTLLCPISDASPFVTIERLTSPSYLCIEDLWACRIQSPIAPPWLPSPPHTHTQTHQPQSPPPLIPQPASSTSTPPPQQLYTPWSTPQAGAATQSLVPVGVFLSLDSRGGFLADVVGLLLVFIVCIALVCRKLWFRSGQEPTPGLVMRVLASVPRLPYSPYIHSLQRPQNSRLVAAHSDSPTWFHMTFGFARLQVIVAHCAQIVKSKVSSYLRLRQLM